jgi:hypothetical protein
MDGLANTLVWGFCGPIGAAIVKDLGRQGLGVSEWISDQPGSRDIWTFLLGKLEAVEKDPQSLVQYENFYKEHFEEYLVMITRRGLSYATLHEAMNEFSLAYHCFSGLLRRKNISLVLFENMPHEGQDFVLYHLAKHLGIKTLLCYQTLFANKFFIITTIDDLGPFMTCPDLFDDKTVVLAPGYRQQSVNMDGFNLADSRGGAHAPSGVNRTRAPRSARSASFLGSPVRSVKERIKSVLIRNSAPNLQRWYVRRLREHALDGHAVDELIAGQKKFVYFPLHLQPELTTSAFGGVYQDQLYAIELLSALVKEDWIILVKENPKQTFFQRGELFFRRLRALGNVRLVGGAYSTYKLLEESQFTATISGTACWEALKGGKKCLIFGQAWYSALPGCYTYREGFDFDGFLAATQQQVPFEELRAAFERLMSKAGDGVIDKDYSCLVAGFEVEINAKKAAGSMMQVLHSAKTRWA